MPRQHPEPQQWPDNEQRRFIAQAEQQLNQGQRVYEPIRFEAGIGQPRRRENREFTPDLWDEVQTLILELSDLKKKLIEKGVI